MIFNRLVEAVSPDKNDPFSSLPWLLLLLTMVTGLVDAVSILKLGHVFVANMTGNIVFLGFALGGAKEFSYAASTIAIIAFSGGAFVGGYLNLRYESQRARLLMISTLVKIAIVSAALIVSLGSTDSNIEVTRYSLIVLLGLAMGLQNAIARNLGIPDLTTTVLTLTLTGLAADSASTSRKPARQLRRIVAVLTMFLGAIVGALLVLRFGVSSVLLLVLVLLAISTIASSRMASSTTA